MKQIAPQHVKPYLRGNKNDYNDALAIAEAVVRPEMRFVRTKTQEQQDIKALHVMRKKCERDRTANCNEVRGLLAEYGIVINQGVNNVYKRLPELFDDASNNGLSLMFKGLLKQHYKKLVQLEEHMKEYTRQIIMLSKSDECERLQSVPSIGPMIASALYQHIGSGSEFKNGRAVAASLGLVPKQHSSGGKNTLLGINKRGDGYLRTLLVHSARAVLRTNANKQTPLADWLRQIEARRGKNKATVALANKMARIACVILSKGGQYEHELAAQ